MRSRRDRHHHPEAVTRLAAWAVAAVLLTAGPAAGAGNGFSQALDERGRLHRVEVEPWVSGGKILGTTLRHIIVNPDGTKESGLIPGTDDVPCDRDPALRIDPSTDEPVLVWSRHEGVGFDIFISRYHEGAWSALVPLPSSAGDDVAPQLQVGFRNNHVVYRSGPDEQRSWSRLVLDRGTLAPVFGPEPLPTSTQAPVPSVGATYSDTEPPFWDFFFASELIRSGPTDPGIVMVWGVRDDPMPIDYAQSFQCPAGVRDVMQSEAGYLAGRFALRFVSGDRFPYVLRSAGSWSEMRSIELSDKLSPDSARLMLRDMIWRGWIP